MKPRNLLVVGLLMILSGWVGVWIGERKLEVSYRNWKPAVVYNKVVPGTSSASDVDFSLFWTAWDKVSQNYVDKTALDSKKMLDGAISGMVSALGDPYTAYFPIQQNKDAKEDLGGAFSGVGIQLGYKEGTLAVMSPIDGSPAKNAGVRSADLILKITDVKNKVEKMTDGITIPEAVKLIRGEKGTKVTLTLAREGVDKPFEVELVRDTIVVKSADVEFKDKDGKKIAWLKLTRFGDRTEEEWIAAVDKIVGTPVNELAGIVLDVRDNPGGYLEGSVWIAGEFLTGGKTVVTQRYGDGSQIDNKVNRNGRLLKIPVVVLVNKGSASAAEILAGALQDHRRAKVVGEVTFGKGSVQQPEDFTDGSGIHITVAKWLRPNGEWIDKKGITPDVIEKYNEEETDETKDNQLEKAMEEL
ncbi:MAG: S41 family peptidase [Patescibacteria group bacterium]